MKIDLASHRQLEEVLSWLAREQAETCEGFYCNKDIIAAARNGGDMFCASTSGSVIGFWVHTVKSNGASIDILEVHPDHRGYGLGRCIAQHAVERLFAAGAAFITVRCAPRSSKGFWQKLGFTPKHDRWARPMDPPTLVLHHLNSVR